MEEKNFGYLGFSFQQSLIKAIIEDKKYGETIIDVLESKYFENNSDHRQIDRDLFQVLHGAT